MRTIDWTYPPLCVGLDHLLHAHGPLCHLEVSPLASQLQNRAAGDTREDVASAEGGSDEFFLAWREGGRERAREGGTRVVIVPGGREAEISLCLQLATSKNAREGGREGGREGKAHLAR